MTTSLSLGHDDQSVLRLAEAIEPLGRLQYGRLLPVTKG